MRHRRTGRKFGLPSDQRRSLLKGLTRSLIQNDSIITTECRAKDVRVIAEKLVTIARKGVATAEPIDQVNARRLVRKYIDSNVKEFVSVPGEVTSGKQRTTKIERSPDYVVPRLFEEIAPRYMDRPGGYTRITRYKNRRGDGALLVLLEFVR